MRTGLTKQEKTTDIWFDEKDPLIHIRTHNTDLKKRLLAYSSRYPAICQQTDAGAFLFPSDRPIQRGTPQGGKRGGEKVRRSWKSCSSRLYNRLNAFNPAGII